MRSAGRRAAVRRVGSGRARQRLVCAAARGDRGPLALRTSGHRGIGHHRGAANVGGTGRIGRAPVNTELPQDVRDFAAVAAKRLGRLGGPAAALRAETDDAVRDAARTALHDVGAFELDVRSAPDDLLAAAVLCQSAGATALPYPVVEELLAVDGARLALIHPEAPRIDHGDLPGDWVAADLDGARYHPQPAARTNAKLGPFLVPVTISAPDGTVPAADVNLHLVLGSWRILGAMQQSLHIVTEHVRARVQFGKPLADFQAVRFAVADASVAVRGLHELAKYTVCRPKSLPVEAHSAD